MHSDWLKPVTWIAKTNQRSSNILYCFETGIEHVFCDNYWQKCLHEQKIVFSQWLVYRTIARSSWSTFVLKNNNNTWRKIWTHLITKIFVTKWGCNSSMDPSVHFILQPGFNPKAITSRLFQFIFESLLWKDKRKQESGIDPVLKNQQQLKVATESNGRLSTYYFYKIWAIHGLFFVYFRS